MSLYDCSKFKIRISPDSEGRQELCPGDLVRRQYKDRTRTVYSLMVVLDAGQETITATDGTQRHSPYFVGALLEGDEPRDGELLDFVRVSNLFDPSRSGALYLTGSDSEAPYMDVIDGVGTAHALSFPRREGYLCAGEHLLTALYKESEEGISRIFRVTKNDQGNEAMDHMGVRVSLPKVPAHPARLIVSYKIRSSKPCSQVHVSFGIPESDREAEQDIETTTQWQYRIFAVTVDLPVSYERELLIDFKGVSYDLGDWWEVAELNISPLSVLATLAGATKARVGRITGVADPLFGVLDGYGAYFQNLYATGNVNIAGTLTAGDQNGFASTFYVGCISKNCMLSSLQPRILTSFLPSALKPPTGIGKFYMLSSGTSIIECQSEAWAEAHAGETYCFSFWIKSNTPHRMAVSCANETLGTVEVPYEWGRRHVNFPVRHVAGTSLQIAFQSANICYFTSPQLEEGVAPSLYQPTDEVLTEGGGYGAWMARGGIGGTIQNPLLKLNPDGSIASKDNSFVINADGTGHFSGGRFAWTKDAITLRDVTLKWDDIQGAPEAVQCIVKSNQPYTQVYTKESNSCVPNWALSPFLVLTPSLFAGEDMTVDRITQVADPESGTPGVVPDSVVWYKNGKPITSGTSSSTIAGADKKYALTIKANAIGTYAPQMRYGFEAVWMNKTGTCTPVRGEVQFTLLVSAASAIRAVAYAPDGTVFRNGEIATLRAHCDLWRGAVIDSKKALWTWGVRDQAVFAPTKLSQPASKGDTVITVLSAANMVAGHTLNMIYEPFTIAAVDAVTNQVTLSAPVTGDKSAGCMITCPNYNADLGPGWFPLSAENPRGVVAGWDADQITLTPVAVPNCETFKCAVRDNDTNQDNPSRGKVVSDMLSFSDMSDPITVTISSPDGFMVSATADTAATALLLRGTQEVDPEGTDYTYQWKLWDSTGERVVATYTGKSITVPAGTVADKGVLMVEVFG